MGVLSVVVVRGIISICCHKEEDEFTQAELRRQEEEAKKLRLLGQNPDGGADKEGDFMSEAKDWAGELISGQTGTGRILVRQAHVQNKCFALKFKFQRNASKFPIFI